MAAGQVDALELSGSSGFGLTNTRNWVALVEPCALKCAKTRISANDTQIRHRYRKHTVFQTSEPLDVSIRTEMACQGQGRYDDL
jgi:hypothetical protein